MTAPAIALALALPVAVAWQLAAWIGLGTRRSPLAAAGLLATAVLAGIGLSSLVSFAWLLAGGALGRAFVVADASLFALLTTGIALWRRRVGGTPGVAAVRTASSLDRAAMVALGAALVVAIGCIVALSAATPHGEMDAWMIWNLRARFLLRAGEGWRAGFARDLYWTKTEYPLLLPLAIARLWAYAGETPLAPAALACAFTVAAPLALAAAVGASGEAWRGALAALLLLGSPGFVALGASQYADVPLAALLVAGVGAIVSAPPDPGRARTAHLMTAGLLVGLAGWTKNEGIAAAAIVVAVQGAFAARAGGIRGAARDVTALLAGAALPAAAWLALHHVIMPRVTGALFMGETFGTIAQRLADGERWAAVLGGLARRMPGLHIGFPALVVAVAALLAARGRTIPRSQAIPIAAVLFTVHTGVFMLTTWDLSWHIRLAADRLLLQVWPVLLLGLFAVSPQVRRRRSTPDATAAICRQVSRSTRSESGVSASAGAVTERRRRLRARDPGECPRRSPPDGP